MTITNNLEHCASIGRLVPLKPKTKTPWIKSVIKGASLDPEVIAKWVGEKPGCGWGLRIESDDLLVLDVEGKRKAGVTQSGLHRLYWLQQAYGQLPKTWTVRTRSSGRHLSFRLPSWARGHFRNSSRVLPGIDVRTARGLVVLPGTWGYSWTVSPDESRIAEAPMWLTDELLNPNGGRGLDVSGGAISDKAEPAALDTNTVSIPETVPLLDITPIGLTKREWIRLWRSGGGKAFAAVWRRQRPDLESNSEYELPLLQRALRQGLSPEQSVSVVMTWWAKHGIQGDLIRLVERIMPTAWANVAEYVQAFRAAKEDRKAAGRKNGDLRRATRKLLQSGTRLKRSQIANALDRDENTVKAALGRMKRAGEIVHTPDGYALSCTTTALNTNTVSISKTEHECVSSAQSSVKSIGAAA